MKKVGFGRELKSRVSGNFGYEKSRVRTRIEISGIGYFRVLYRRLKTSNGSGTEKVGFGRVREFPKFQKSG